MLEGKTKEQFAVLKDVVTAFAEIAALYDTTVRLGRNSLPKESPVLAIFDNMIAEAVGKANASLKPRLHAAFSDEIEQMRLAEAQVAGGVQ
jgi:hypothetical protein